MLTDTHWPLTRHPRLADAQARPQKIPDGSGEPSGNQIPALGSAGIVRPGRGRERQREGCLSLDQTARPGKFGGRPIKFVIDCACRQIALKKTPDGSGNRRVTKFRRWGSRNNRPGSEGGRGNKEGCLSLSQTTVQGESSGRFADNFKHRPSPRSPPDPRSTKSVTWHARCSHRAHLSAVSFKLNIEFDQLLALPSPPCAASQCAPMPKSATSGTFKGSNGTCAWQWPGHVGAVPPPGLRTPVRRGPASSCECRARFRPARFQDQSSPS